MKKSAIKEITFISMYTAIAFVLELVSRFIPALPQGGSIELGLIPVYVCSYHLGYKKGICVGFLWWLVGLISGGNNYYLCFLQYCFDYLVPFCICGLASVFPSFLKISKYYTGIFVTMCLKYLSHVISGVYFFAEYGPAGSACGNTIAWVYSLGYNAPYCMVDLIICILVVPVLIHRLKLEE